jgi:putative tryptophan/tyrosine transport system substrate-binding protein
MRKAISTILAMAPKRRAFITLLGGAVAWPLAARGQQPVVPVIGFLSAASADGYTDRVRAFRQGLRDAGYVEGDNVAIEYRWAEGQYDRLPALAAELVRRQVAVIVAAPTASALVAKSATATIPNVFTVGDDPVKLGLDSSLARPGGNLTGVNFFGAEVVSKRLELLRELIPRVGRLAVLVNPSNATISEITVREVEAAARGMGVQVQVFNAVTSREIDAAFANLVHERSDAVFVGGDAFFTNRRVQLATLAARYVIPSSFSQREVTEAGGLMSYAANIRDTYRQAGVYVGRILKGAKPADLPVVQSTKFELVINAQTARMLSLTVPDRLLALADEVIE